MERPPTRGGLFVGPYPQTLLIPNADRADVGAEGRGRPGGGGANAPALGAGRARPGVNAGRTF